MDKSKLFFAVVTIAITLAGIASIVYMQFLPKKILHRVKRKTEDKFILEALAEHNRLRALHKSPPLVLDRKLCPFAEEWSKKIADESEAAGKITQTHSHIGLGENLACCKCHDWNGTAVSRAWYNEIKQHNFSDKFQYKTGHFTQMVWKESKTFCIAYTKTKRFISIVAHYMPRGNMNYVKSFQDNVKKIGK